MALGVWAALETDSSFPRRQSDPCKSPARVTSLSNTSSMTILKSLFLSLNILIKQEPAQPDEVTSTQHSRKFGIVSHWDLRRFHFIEDVWRFTLSLVSKEANDVFFYYVFRIFPSLPPVCQTIPTPSKGRLLTRCCSLPWTTTPLGSSPSPERRSMRLRPPRGLSFSVMAADSHLGYKRDFYG